MPSSHCCRSPEQPDRLDDNCASCWHSQVCRWAPAGVGSGAGLVKAPLSLYIPVLAAHLEVQGSRVGEVPLRGSTPNRQPWVDCSVFPPLCPVSSTALAMAGLAQGPAAVWSPQGLVRTGISCPSSDLAIRGPRLSHHGAGSSPVALNRHNAAPASVSLPLPCRWPGWRDRDLHHIPH